MRVAFVTNICAHYRVRTFETLARFHDVDYFFFSAGDEWYWQAAHGVRAGAFRYEYLPGVSLRGTRITPTLPFKLLAGGYDAYVKGINGRLALPLTYLIARLRRRPFVLWTGIWMRLQTPFHRRFFAATRYIYRHADAIVVYGSHVRDYLISEGVAAERIFVAAHAVDNDSYRIPVSRGARAALRERLSLAPTTRVLLYLGRLEESKGLRDLLHAFAQLESTGTVLVIAGTGTQQEELRRLAGSLGVAERVRFPGYIPVERAVDYYALAYAYILPSVTLPSGKEPWGLVVNEAFNQGVPVVATDAVGAAAGGLVRDGVTGLVVPERSPQRLAQALQRLLDEPDLRERMAEAARDEVARWTNERMVRGFREALDYVTRDRQGLRAPE